MTSKKSPKPFTSFAHAYADGGEPTLEQLDEVWDALRYRLFWALRSRSMWNQPPIYFGVDHEQWASRKNARGVPLSGMRDSLDELTQAAFEGVLLKKLKNFAGYVREGRDVEGAVRRALDHFLSDLQKDRDPLGYDVYKLLKSAADEGIQRGELRTAEGEDSVTSSTILVFEGSSPRAEPSPEAIQDPARRWNEELFADWLTIWGQGTVRMAEEALLKMLKGLPREGVFVVRFGDLVNAVKSDVRVRVSEELASWGPGPVQRTEGDPRSARDAERRWRRWIESEESFESFRALSKCVEQGIDQMPGQKRTREDAGRLWNLLKHWFRSSPNTPPGLDPQAWAELLDVDSFSQRKIGDLLGKHHDRIGDLLDHLKPKIRSCLETTGSGKTRPAGDTDTLDVDAPSQEQTMNEKLDFQQQLLAQARRAVQAEEKEAVRPAVEGSRVGELLFLGDRREPAVEWLVLDEQVFDEQDFDEQASRLLLVPVDCQSWVGPNDAPLPDDDRTARLGLGWWIAAHDLPESSGPRVDVSELVTIHRQVIDDTREVGSALWDVAADPHYRSWIHTLDAERRQLCAELNGRLDGARNEVATTPEPTEPPAPISFAEAREKKQARSQESAYRPLGGWQLAAALVLTIGSGLLGGVTFQQMRFQPRLVESEAERQRLETRNQELNDRLEAQQELTQAELDALRDEAEAARKEDRKAFQTRLDQVTTGYEDQLDLLDQPEVVVSSLFVSEGIQRSDPEELPVNESDRSVLLEIEALEGDRLRIAEWPGERTIFETTVSGLPEGRNLPLRVPTRLLSTGEYRVYVERDGQQVTLFRFSIEKDSTP